MRRSVLAICLGFLVACSGGKGTPPETSGDPPPGPVMNPPPGPPPGGPEPGACHNVGVPKGSSCRLSGLRVQHCTDCPSDWHRYRVTYFVKVDGADQGFDAGTFRVQGDRYREFEAFLKQHSSVPCSGMIVRPPCNPSATHVKLELDWPAWLVRERD